VQILDLLEHKAIFTAGYKAILHLHSLVEECEVTNLIAQVDRKTGEKKKVRRMKVSMAYK
jgi:peptide chain release factor subunit 3